MNILRIMGLLTRRPCGIVTESKVLVCSLDTRFRDSLEADSSVYSKYYRGVRTVFFSRMSDLLRAIESGYDIVHLFSPLSPTGLVADGQSTTLSGTDLIGKCCESEVKLLWIANENEARDYVKGFNAAGKPLNLIMTISRNGAKFDRFLDELLSRVSSGETLPLAWVSLVPQAQGPWQQEVPGCIFHAGRAAVKLPGVPRDPSRSSP